MCLGIYANEGSYKAHYCDPGVNVDYDLEQFTFLDYITDWTKIADDSDVPYYVDIPYYDGPLYIDVKPYYTRPDTKK